MSKRNQMELLRFKERLQKIVPNPPSWLFMCDGSPFCSELFLIGTNPARNTGFPFWKSYWDDTVGQNRNRLLPDLKQLEGGFSSTRKKIEKFRKRIKKNVLEANVYSRDTPGRAGLTVDDAHEEAMFEVLFEAIKPPLVVAHGEDALLFFQGVCRSLTKERLCTQRFRWGNAACDFIYCRHFSRIWDEEFETLIAMVNRHPR